MTAHTSPEQEAAAGAAAPPAPEPAPTPEQPPAAAPTPPPTAAAPADEPPASSVRLWAGRVLGPILALLTYLLLPEDPQLSTAARTTAAIVVLVAVWWMTEALPLPATALLPLVAFPLLGVLEMGEASAPYADQVIFLFMGGFMIALAMQKWHLHKRIALLTMRAIGTRPRQLVLGVMVATAFLSMWVSNTATALMMLPIGISVLALVVKDGDQSAQDRKDVRNFAVGLMLAIAYAASIGGLATLVGSPPNAILAGFVEQNYEGVTVGFADWMKIGVPLSVVFLILAWLVITRLVYPTRLREIAGGRQLVQSELAKLGKMSRGEWNVLAVFAATAALWVFREPISGWEAVTGPLPFLAHLNDASIAIAAALALFLIPVSVRQRFISTLDWRTAQAGIPWGVLLLFGGGLSLATAIQETGLSEYIGEQVSGFGVLPVVLVVAAICLVVLLLTELTSNTATAATFLPVLGGVAIGLGIDPLLLLAPAAFAATCAFMLPVGTPPNAIVFGSGHVTMGQMVRAGVWLNLLGVALITAATFLIGGWAMGISF